MCKETIDDDGDGNGDDDESREGCKATMNRNEGSFIYVATGCSPK